MNEQHTSRDGERVEKMMKGEGVSGETGGGDLSGSAMSVSDYRKMRRGYERTIAPAALEQIGAQERTTAAPEAVRTSRRVVRIAPEPYAAAPDSYNTYAPAEPPRRRSGIGPVAVLLIVAVGLIGGLALYAGGAEYIAGLFEDDTEERVEDLTLVTERPGAASEADEGMPTPAEAMLAEDEEDGEEMDAAANAPQPEEDIAAAERESRIEAEKVAAAREADRRKQEAEKKAAAERAAALLREEKAARQKAPSESNAGVAEVAESTEKKPAAGQKPAATSPRFTAQVGATPDRKEAERIAATLRSRGASAVSITTAQKDGAPLYRVRYGSFASEEDARRQSSAIGYSNVWIVNLR